MNGRWIDQFPPEREYDLEIDEDTYELQMADAAAAQAAADSAAESAHRAEEIAQGLREEIPTKVSELENDSNYAVDANYVHTDNNFTSSEKNKLEGIAAGAEVNVNADWNATSGDAAILNKPTIPSKVSDLIDDSGHYTKPANGIPASDLEETYLTEHQDISGKADKSEIPTAVSQLDNDAGYITGYTETDPTVPAWAKALTKPSYTASEVGAPTVQEMNTAINNAIGSVNSFDVAVVQTLPSENISTHTIYLVPKTGETNDVYDEYIYINNAWEMVGNTQIDLSDYATKSEIPDVPVEDVQINGTTILNNGIANIPLAGASNIPGLVKVNINYGIAANPLTGEILTRSASNTEIKKGTDWYRPITSYYQHAATFYGLAKAAGDTTQSQSSNAVGTYTDEAKSAIQTMLNVPDKSQLDEKIPNITYGEPKVVLEETTLNFVKDGDNDWYYTEIENFGFTNNTSDRSNFIIEFDGVEYSELYIHRIGYVTQNGDVYSSVFIGNGLCLGMERKDNCPFCLYEFRDAKTITRITAYNNQISHTIKISVQNCDDIVIVPKEKYYELNQLHLIQIGSGNGAYGIGSSISELSGDVSFAIGGGTKAKGSASFAAGYNSEASGFVSEAHGWNGLASGSFSFTEGRDTTASGNGSHAEGRGTTASSIYSHAEGYQTTASGAMAHAEGRETIASGSGSHAEGWNSTASGMLSHVEGASTIANHMLQHVFGQANIADPSTAASNERGTYVEIIGNGTGAAARSNARTLDWSGNERLAGDLTIHAGGVGEMTVGEALSDTQAMLTTVETTTTASKAYAVGDLLVYDGQLYKVTSAITLGSTLIPDGNIEATTIEQELLIANNDVTDVQVNGTSVLNNGVANVPLASSSVAGAVIVKPGDHGLQVASNGMLQLYRASDAECKAGTQSYRSVTPIAQHISTFYGLAKAAGDTTQSASSNAVGAYTDEAKVAIKEMLGIQEGLKVVRLI